MYCLGCHGCLEPCGRNQGWDKLDIVFVIGNGVSRKGLDLHALIGKGKIVICNEAYREFKEFDAIASVDGTSTIDIKENCNLKGKHHIYKWRNDWLVDEDNKGQLVGSYNSGQLAVLGAIELYSPKTVYTLGVDFGGKRLYTGKISGEPTNKCWDTWDRLAERTDLIHVPKDLKYEDCVFIREWPQQG